MLHIDRTSYVSPNCDARPAGVRPSAIMLHSCEGRPFGNESASSLPWLCNPQRKDPRKRVSCHYYVCRSGLVFQLVPDELRAWHAGKTNYLGRDDWADISIGIELEHARGSAPYPAAQLAALVALGAQLVLRWQIRHEMIVAHRWVATPPKRKVDPTDMSDAEIRHLVRAMLDDASASAPTQPLRFPTTPAAARYVLISSAWVRASASPRGKFVETLERGTEFRATPTSGDLHEHPTLGTSSEWLKLSEGRFVWAPQARRIF